MSVLPGVSINTLDSNLWAQQMSGTETKAGQGRALRGQTAQARFNQASLNKSDYEKAEKAAKEFEAMFMSQMLKPMFESIPVNETFGGGRGEEVFRSFLVQEYGKILSEEPLDTPLRTAIRDSILARAQAANAYQQAAPQHTESLKTEG